LAGERDKEIGGAAAPPVPLPWLCPCTILLDTYVAPKCEVNNNNFSLTTDISTLSGGHPEEKKLSKCHRNL